MELVDDSGLHEEGVFLNKGRMGIMNQEKRKHRARAHWWSDICRKFLVASRRDMGPVTRTRCRRRARSTRWCHVGALAPVVVRQLLTKNGYVVSEL